MEVISDLSALSSPPGLDRDFLHYFSTYVIGAETRKRPRSRWVGLARIYSESEDVEMRNKIASCGLVPFVTPGSLLEAARDDPNFEVREAKEGRGWECRRKAMDRVSKKLSMAISAILRYEVEGWMSLCSLQHVLNARLGRHIPLGSIFIIISGDALRFQLDTWRGELWARANYKYSR